METLIGHIGVDAGLVMIGDPCYVSQDNHPANRGWASFCDWFQTEECDDHPKHVKIPFDLGHEGLGIVLESGIGDGFYPVYATYGEIDGFGERITSVRVDFTDHPLIGG